MVIALLVMSNDARAEQARPPAEKNANTQFMHVFGAIAPPRGYVEFCQRLPRDCEAVASSPARIDLTSAKLAELDYINRTVNHEIEPATDWELYGVEDYWTYPDGRKKGDCEDYVLLKRKLLIEQGWPQSALLITVVLDEADAGHAILTIRAALGDFIVDNKNDSIKRWYETPYRFLMRQSTFNLQAWLSLEPQNAQTNGIVAGLQRAR